LKRGKHEKQGAKNIKFFRSKIEKENQKNEEQVPVKRKDKLVSGVSFNTTLVQEPTDIHEITPPESSESLFKPSKPEDIVIKRATPIEETIPEETPEVNGSKPDSPEPVSLPFLFAGIVCLGTGIARIIRRLLVAYGKL
jgi:hypothetical protein